MSGASASVPRTAASELQAKLLRVLEEGELERVGGESTIGVDVRMIAASNQDLDVAVEEGRFRPDLFYRLNVFPLWVPPLRERAEDIPLLVQHFASVYSAKLGKTIRSVPDDAMNRLMSYEWPGNVRELKNVVERAVIVSEGPELLLGERLWSPQQGGGRASFRSMEEMQREHIRAALERTGGVVSGDRGAARLLGMKSTTLFSRMKKLGIERNGD